METRTYKQKSTLVLLQRYAGVFLRAHRAIKLERCRFT